MKCTEARQQIQLLDRYDDLQQPVNSSLASHVGQCELCRHYASDALLLRELQKLETPEPSAEFLARALVRAQEPVRRRWLPAVAASLLLTVAAGWLGFGALPPSSQDVGPVIAEAEQIQPAGYHRQEVRIVIHSQVDRDDAELTIELAENLELEGFGGQQRIAWHTAVKKGPNLLVLPVRAHDKGGELRVTSMLGDKALETRVRVEGTIETNQSGAAASDNQVRADEIS